jgi:callose synthase
VKGSDAQLHQLVFSDEFNSLGRLFANGQDLKWTALNVGDTSNKGAAFYLPEQAAIAIDANVSGPPVSALLITTENSSHVGTSPTGEEGIFMPFKSAMLQTWNKFCFTGGIVEFKARQPRGGGYWPALWLFGNLGRAVYQNSNTGLWPWSYDSCDADLELPPSDPPQRISACDHHNIESEGLHAFQGRGATELDVLEGAVSNTGSGSYVVGSLQLSPGIPSFFRPPLFGFPTSRGAGMWYTGLTFGSGGTVQTDGFANNGWYGPPWGSDCPTGCPDALSGGLVDLGDLDTRYWTYRMEWKTGPTGQLSWYYDGAFVWGMSAASFGAYSICSVRAGVQDCSRTPARQIPEEPMSLVMNTAIGTWNGGRSALDGKHWPALFWIDYVRVWQHEINVGCNPPDYPTMLYIQQNAMLYGEAVQPSGYDTCPEVYPSSAFDNAKSITQRAHVHGVAFAEGLMRVATSTPAAGLDGSQPGVDWSFAATPIHMERWFAKVATLWGAWAIGCSLLMAYAHRRLRATRMLCDESSFVRDYEELRRYSLVSEHPALDARQLR